MTELREILEKSGPFASVLIDVSRDSENAPQAVEIRARDAARTLVDQGAPDEVASRIRTLLEEPVHEPAPRSRYVVVDEEEVLLDEVLPIRSDVLAAWGALPDLGPLLLHRAEGLSFVVVSVDHTGGTVSTYDSHTLDAAESTEVAGEEHYVQKVRGAGMAHRRYQQTTENLWRDNAREVGQVALSETRHGHGLVIVAGSPESRGEVVDALAGTPAEVVALDRAGENDDGGAEALAIEIRTAVEQHLEEQRRDREDLLQQRLGRGEGAVVGLEAVADALELGQVGTLVVDLAALREERVDPAARPALALPENGPVRADLALVAAALRTDAEIVPTPHGVDRPVAALLRWDEAS